MTRQGGSGGSDQQAESLQLWELAVLPCHAYREHERGTDAQPSGQSSQGGLAPRGPWGLGRACVPLPAEQQARGPVSKGGHGWGALEQTRVQHVLTVQKGNYSLVQCWRARNYSMARLREAAL